MVKNLPDFSFEKKLWRKGIKFVGGCDEVGKGSFAGPVVTAAVIYPIGFKIENPFLNKKGEKIIIDDSKKLTPSKRLKAEKWIKENCLAWGVGMGTVSEINKFGLSKATNSGFRRAIAMVNNRMNKRIDYLLIDAFYIPYIRGLCMPSKNVRKSVLKKEKSKNLKFYSNQLAIIKGDERSLSIASASIIAKVYRDKLMVKISENPKYKKYGWKENKGYGTKKHKDAIKRYGITQHHRKQFVLTSFNNSSSFRVQ